MGPSFSFEVLKEDRGSGARLGVVGTTRGEIQTPVFMPVGTAATVKGLPQHVLEGLDARVILANTYHLYLRPGPETVRRLGGLHGFMSWERPILTDSGGFQVFSHRDLRRISEEGVEFRSHLDGGLHFLSPERSIEIQAALGADIVMAFDDCTPYPVTWEQARQSMLRSKRWAERCRRVQIGPRQTLFGIVQGSVFPDLRRESLEALSAMDFAGLALGGFSVGESTELMHELVSSLAPLMPAEKPRYLMGVGTPQDLVAAVKAGIDMFDCVLPTRNARNGTLFTSRGKIRIKNARWKEDREPLDPVCRCPVCARYSRAYLRHLFVSGEILASVLNTWHNLHFYLDLMARIRESIGSGSLAALEREVAGAYSESG